MYIQFYYLLSVIYLIIINRFTVLMHLVIITNITLVTVSVIDNYFVQHKKK